VIIHDSREKAINGSIDGWENKEKRGQGEEQDSVTRL